MMGLGPGEERGLFANPWWFAWTDGGRECRLVKNYGGSGHASTSGPRKVRLA